MRSVGDIYGPACDQVPLQGEGSALGMVDDPVGTAASNNPLLRDLVQAVGAADLLDSLNDRNAEFTVFAPANSAFESQRGAWSVPVDHRKQLLGADFGSVGLHVVDQLGHRERDVVAQTCPGQSVRVALHVGYHVDPHG